MTSIQNIIKNNPAFDSSLFLFEYSLKSLSSFKIGGNAEVLFMPQEDSQLYFWLDFFLKNNFPVSIIGGCSNLLIDDSGIKGVVVSLNKLKHIKMESDSVGQIFVYAEAGVLIDELCEWCVENSISGFENFSGLPGTVGGALYMNAKCYDKSISDILVSANTVVINTPKLVMEKYCFNQSDWNYKKSPFQIKSYKKNNSTDIFLNPAGSIEVFNNRKIITSAVFRLNNGDKENILIKTKEFKSDRIQKGHFKAPSAGSVFKNNRDFGIPTGKIIEDAGLKGFSIGGAAVADWHGNFIINKGGASSKDILNLIHYIKHVVFERKGFTLEPEIIYAGS